MKICRCQIRGVWWVWQYFPAVCLNSFFSHIRYMWAGVVMQYADTMLSIRSFFLSSRFESFDLLNIEFHVACLVSFQQFVMNNPLPVSPYALYRFTRMKIFVSRACQLFLGTKSLLALLHIDVQAPFFITSNNC